VPSSAIAQNSGIWIRKRIKNGSSCASRKPEVTIKPYDKVITKMQYLMMVCLWCIGDKKYYFEI
jgi:hypothetical protein